MKLRHNSISMKQDYSFYFYLKICTIALVWLVSFGRNPVCAQADFNLTQFQNTPFLSNPAMIAGSDRIRFLLNFRNQPNATGDNFINTMINGFYPLFNRRTGKRWGGIGAAFAHDQAGAFLRTNAGLLGFAYNLNLGYNKLGYNGLSFGIQGGYYQRNLSLDGLTTSSQFINGGFVPGSGINEFNENTSQGFGALSTGLMWYALDTLDRQTAFLGVSLFNFNEPETSFYDELNSNLPNHWTVIGGIRVLDRLRFSLMPNFRWVNRSGNHQVQAGTWLNFNVFPRQPQGLLKNGVASVGLWYHFNDAFVGALQWDQPNYFLTLSFDLPTTNTSDVWQGNNAFEVTLGLKLRRKFKRKTYPATPVDKIVEWPEEPELLPEPMNVPTIVPPIPSKPKPRTKPGLEDGAFRFKFNSSELDDRSKALLDSVSQVLMEYPEAVIYVSGHTCDIGAATSNLALSRERAESVKKYLIEYDGIDPKRIKVDAYGETRPLVPNTSEPNRVKNRRVAFKMRFPDE